MPYTLSMITRRTYERVTWVDLESPTISEVRSLVEEYQIDALTAEELLFPTVRPRLEIHDRYIYAVLHFPALRHTHTTQEQEIDFIVGSDFIITARYESIDALHKFAKVFDVNSVLNTHTVGAHAGFVFFYLLKKMYKSVEHEVSFIHDALKDIEGDIFAGREREMVVAISRTGRDLLNLRQVIEPHRDILVDLDTRGHAFFAAAFAPYIKALINEYYRVHNHVMRHIESVHELRETNNSLLYTKQNEVMKTLTIMALVTFPLSLIANIFSMNTVHTPVLGVLYDFWVIIGLMVSGAITMFWYFKHKHWL